MDRRVHVAAWHRRVLCSLGLELLSVSRVQTAGFGYGANLERPFPERLLVYSSPG
jgi:hypothetical protein